MGDKRKNDTAYWMLGVLILPYCRPFTPFTTYSAKNMARSLGSPSLSPRSISPSFSESSAEDNDDSALSEPQFEPFHSSPAGTPAPRDRDKSAKNAEPDAVTCLWDDCGEIFTHLPTLIDHIHKGVSQGDVGYDGALLTGHSSYWGSQVKLYMRMGNLFSTRPRANVAVRSYLTYPFAHGRETIHLSSSRSVSISYVYVTYININT